MSRVNFYQLLELKIHPPESNPEVIDAAIKRKQAEWSRLRNHPTKGTHARQYISLLNDIRKVMGDSRLREEEARNAVDLLRKKLGAKFKVIDSQLDLLGSNGDISEAEVDRLAGFHKVKPQIIQKRVDHWRKKHGHPLAIHLSRLLARERPEEKAFSKIAAQFGCSLEDVQKVLNRLLEERWAELDTYISIQIRKGFMSEKEIASLAEIYALNQGDILRRIRCPIRKDSESETEHTYQLDSTVEQFINDNLNVVEHDSLYSFLGLFPGSTLEALQKKAVDKEKEIRKISHKDAHVTASGVLVGQCISIFKSDENRYAYDLSRARSLLKNLNQDIGLAVDQDTIRIEYYSHLLRKAVSFGTPPDKARQHILDYCHSKNWRVELPRRKLNLKRYARIAAATTGILLIAGAIFWYFYFSHQRLLDEYARTLKIAGEQPTLEAQLSVIESFRLKHAEADIGESAAMNIESLRKRIAKRDFDRVTADAEKLLAAQQFEDAGKRYTEFLARHADFAEAEQIRQKLAEIPGLIDERDYQAVARIAPDKPEEIAHAGVAYLRRHPDGANVRRVREMIQEAEGPYYRGVVKALEQCEKSADWNQCIVLTSRYIDVYRDSTPALVLKERRDQYQLNLQNKTILDTLVSKAGGMGADPAAQQTVFEAFLRDSPNSSAAALVRSELARIERVLGDEEAQQELERLRRTYGQRGGRFALNNQDTVRDTKTRLIWALLDSHYLTDQCLTYEEALGYVNSMSLGGYSDWRLPRAKELVGLYSGPSAFQGTSRQWYWSADNFKRYAGQWVILVDAVHPSPNPLVQKKNSENCGWFRAVRP